MRKKAKRRGRPPGSKNKKLNGVGKVTKSFAKMEVGQLRALIDDLEGLLAKKVQQQREILQGHLTELQGYVSAKAAGVVRTVMRVPRTSKRAKAAPQFRSRKDPKLVWSGRGMTVGWLKAEMKETGKPKEFFAIK